MLLFLTRFLVVPLGLVILFSACSYKIKSTRRQLPGDFKRVAIPVFSNKTQETGIEVSFTNALIHQFQRSQAVEVTQVNLCDVKVIGSIESLSYEPSVSIVGGASAPNLPIGSILATSYRVVINLHLKLVRQSDQQILWASSFRGESSYTAPQVTLSTVNTVNPLYNLSARRQNIDGLALDLMTEAHNQMTESF